MVSDPTLWYARDVKEVIKAFSTDVNRGLSSIEAEKRLLQSGKNELPNDVKVSLVRILVGQFGNPLIWLLIFSTGISLFLGEPLEAMAMVAIIVVTVLLGFFQEFRATKEMEALQRSSAQMASVFRDGLFDRIMASDLVCGDIVLLDAGDIVPADLRLFESTFLQIDEASLTGESVPSKKVVSPFKVGTSVADQENMAFSGTVVTYGKGKGIVVATGVRTQLGLIARFLVETNDVKTPLQIKFGQLARQISIVALVLVAGVLVMGMAQGLSFSEMLLTALSLMVATVPNSLPVIVTVGLSFGVLALSRKKLLIKRLPAAESLGAVTVICTDKTGTLTKNEMTVTQVFSNGCLYSVSGAGYSMEGGFFDSSKKIDSHSFELLCRIGALCNNARLSKLKEKSKGNSNYDVTIIGDPTEGALLVLAKKAGLDLDAMKKKFELVQELPFDSDRKQMSMIFKEKSGRGIDSLKVYVKGAPEMVLACCSSSMEDGKMVLLSHQRKKDFLEVNTKLASKALRVLALAYRDISPSSAYSPKTVENSLVFVGLVGMIDPPREGVAKAVEKCQSAGIRVVMVTGDNAQTSRAVASMIGLFKKDDVVILGDEIERMTDSQLIKIVDKIRIVARALPIQKVRLVRALQKKGHLVAMTGDGVNDAPALKCADIGIAMGVTGSDVAKGAAKAVLINDCFETLVDGVEEGRTIYDKMMRSARYLLSCNTGEIITVFSALIIGLPIPLLPLQILLMNMLTDDFPALGLGFETAEDDVMDRPPRDPSKSPITRQIWISILLFGAIMGGGTLWVFWKYLPLGLSYSQTMAFSTLVMFQMFAVVSSRSLSFSFSKLNPFSNLWLSFAVLASVVIQMVIMYVPILQPVFGVIPLALKDWATVIGVSSMGFILMEIGKAIIPGFESNKKKA